MKKILIVAAAALVILATLAVAAVGVFWYSVLRVRAAQPTPGPNGSYGPGMMGGWGRGQGMMGGNWQGRFQGMMGGWGRSAGNGMMNGSGPMHQYVIDALAKALGIKTEDLQSRINKGETPYQVAKSLGKTDAQIQELFDQAHDAAIDAAVKAGALTQQQADWMKQRHDQMWQNGFTAGMPCQGGRGPRALPQPTEPSN